jgi:hypothetical protein
MSPLQFQKNTTAESATGVRVPVSAPYALVGWLRLLLTSRRRLEPVELLGLGSIGAPLSGDEVR